jgi:drug/metabolite transporter (DMT)-like permease
MLPAILTTLLWSCSAICAARSARLVGGAAANVTRMAIATFLLGAWAHFSPLARGLGGPALPWFVASGFVGFGLGDVAMFVALQRIGPRLTMLLTHCLAAPLAAATEWVWLNEALTWKEIAFAGVILGGVALALAPDRGTGASPRAFWLGALAGLGSAAGQGLGSVLSRKANEVAALAGYEVDGGTAAYQRIVVGLLVALAFFLILRRVKPDPAPEPGTWPRAWLWITANALAGPTIGVACYQWGLVTTKTGVIMPVVALSPIVTQLLAWAIDGTKPTGRTILGGFIAVAGVIALRFEQMPGSG